LRCLTWWTTACRQIWPSGFAPLVSALVVLRLHCQLRRCRPPRGLGRPRHSPAEVALLRLQRPRRGHRLQQQVRREGWVAAAVVVVAAVGVFLLLLLLLLLAPSGGLRRPPHLRAERRQGLWTVPDDNLQPCGSGGRPTASLCSTSKLLSRYAAAVAARFARCVCVRTCLVGVVERTGVA
jgi:hypothetical protein